MYIKVFFPHKLMNLIKAEQQIGMQWARAGRCCWALSSGL